jgi:hypothetical protein
MCKLFKHEQQETHLDTKNEKIRNKDGNNQEYEPINHPIANCEIKTKRTLICLRIILSKQMRRPLSKLMTMN